MYNLYKSSISVGFDVMYHGVITVVFIQNTLSLDKCVPHEEHVMADIVLVCRCMYYTVY